MDVKWTLEKLEQMWKNGEVGMVGVPDPNCPEDFFRFPDSDITVNCREQENGVISAYWEDARGYGGCVDFIKS